MTYSQQPILDAILAHPAPPRAKELATPLVEAWIAKFGESDNLAQTLAVEVPFYLWLDKWTLVVGMIDRVASFEGQIFGCEWKSTTPSKWWTEARWLEEIKNGPQIAIYAMALGEGTLLTRRHNAPVDSLVSWCPRVPSPNMLVRAVTKTEPIGFWPKHKNEIFEFNAEKVRSTKAALLNQAAAIQAMRKTGEVPWQLMGRQCFDFGKRCPFLAELCQKANHPVKPAPTLMQASDPGSKAIQTALMEQKLYGIDPSTPGGRKLNEKLVILSASAYTTASACAEKYRIVSGGLKEEPQAIEPLIGSVFHAGVGAFYEQFVGVEENSGGQDNDEV